MPSTSRSSVILPLTIACAMFMEGIDSTVIATSLPVIAQDINESPIALKLALTSYLVSLAIFIPISSWVADRFGSRTVFRSAMWVFILGSVLCGFSQSLEHFVGARFLQGMGGAMMMPVGRVVLMRSVEKHELVRMMSYLTMPALLGPVLGPPIGGLITTYFDWRWIFFINVPICLLGLYMAGRYVPQLFAEEHHPLDVKGFVLTSIGLSTLTLGLATAGQHMLSPLASGINVLVGVIALALYVRHERQTEAPLLSFKFLRVMTYRTSVLGGSLYRMGVGALPFLLPLMLQLGFGFSALQSGLMTCSSAIAAIGIKTQAVRLLSKYGFRKLLIWNTWLACAMFGFYALFTPTTPYLVILSLLFVGGFFRSLQFTALNAMAFADIDKPKMGQASALSFVSDQLALSAGITIAAYLVEWSVSLHGHHQLEASDFRWAFVGVGLIAASSYLFLVRLPHDAGAAVSGVRPHEDLH